MIFPAQQFINRCEIIVNLRSCGSKDSKGKVELTIWHIFACLKNSLIGSVRIDFSENVHIL